MKFKSVILLILLTHLTSCSSITDELIGITKTGAWGPIEVRSRNADDQFFFSPVGSPETKIKVDVIKKNNKLLVYPTEALLTKEIYQLGAEEKLEPKVKNIQIRKTCIVYIVQSDED